MTQDPAFKRVGAPPAHMDGLSTIFVAGYTKQLVAKTKANHEDAEATEKNILDADFHGWMTRTFAAPRGAKIRATPQPLSSHKRGFVEFV